jgi:WD40 repeat protein
MLVPLECPERFDPDRAFLRFSPHGSRLLVWSCNRADWAIVLDVPSGRPFHQFTDLNDLTGALFLDEDRVVLFDRPRNSVHDLAAKRVVDWGGEAITGSDGWASPDPNVIVTGDSGVNRYDHVRREYVRGFSCALHPLGERVSCVGFSPDGRYLAADSYEHRNFRILQLWDLHTGKLFRLYAADYPMGPADARMIAISPDNRLLAVSAESRVTCYGTEHVEPVSRSSARVYAQDLRFLADGRVLEAVEFDGSVVWLDPLTGQTLREAQPPSGYKMTACAVTGDRLAAGLVDRTVLFWQLLEWNEAERTAATDRPRE